MIPRELLNTPYLKLATFRKTGVSVATPVWFARDGEHLYVFSAGNVGKVKRLRNSSKSQVAECTFNGELKGEWHNAEAVLMGADESSVVKKLFIKKYGWQIRTLDFISKMGGHYSKRVYIKIKILIESDKDLSAHL